MCSHNLKFTKLRSSLIGFPPYLPPPSLHRPSPPPLSWITGGPWLSRSFWKKRRMQGKKERTRVTRSAFIRPLVTRGGSFDSAKYRSCKSHSRFHEPFFSRQNWTLRSGTNLRIPTHRFVNYFVIFLWLSTKTRPRLFVNIHKKITNSQKNHNLPTYLRNTCMWVHKFVSAKKYGNAPLFDVRWVFMIQEWH